MSAHQNKFDSFLFFYSCLPQIRHKLNDKIHQTFSRAKLRYKRKGPKLKKKKRCMKKNMLFRYRLLAQFRYLLKSLANWDLNFPPHRRHKFETPHSSRLTLPSLLTKHYSLLEPVLDRVGIHRYIGTAPLKTKKNVKTKIQWKLSFFVLKNKWRLSSSSFRLTTITWMSVFLYVPAQVFPEAVASP